MAGDGRLVRLLGGTGEMTALAAEWQRIVADRLALAVTVIAAITVVSGLFQVVAGGVLLDLFDAENTETTRYFFGIVGMFMAVIGGAVLNAMLAPGDHPLVILWAGIQKLGAVIAVGGAVLLGLFSPLALAIVAFDALSTVVNLAYWRRIR